MYLRTGQAIEVSVMNRCIFTALGVVAITSAFESERAHAQVFTPRSVNLGRATANFIVNRPTVSPYLNLLRQESQVSAPNYQTLVRPQLESRQRASRQQAAISQIQSRVTNMQGQLAARSRGREGFATGHPVRFMTYLHFYPGLNRR